jgi:hypothetical protein
LEKIGEETMSEEKRKDQGKKDELTEKELETASGGMKMGPQSPAREKEDGIRPKTRPVSK